MEYYKVLVLNSTYEPLHFCNAKRAVVMILKGKAEQIEVDGQIIHSPTFSFRLPTVIRLMCYIKIDTRRIISFSKRNVFKRDNYTCQYCGKTGDNMTIDHIIPKSRGGTTTWENVVVACQNCNTKKGDMFPSKVGLKLIRRPVKPSFLLFPSSEYRPLLHIDIWNKYLPDNLKFRHAEN